MLPRPIALAMPTMPMIRNMAFVIIVAVADPARVKRQPRVAAGAIARKALEDIQIKAWVAEIGGDAIDMANFDADEIANNPFFCPDPVAAKRWEILVDGARKNGSSVGAIVACEATGVPAGWGAPVYAKMDSELAAAMMTINATKGVEIGDGFEAARLRGEENADAMRPGNDGPRFGSNHAGGTAGGISTGQPIFCRVAFKPTSSILTPVDTITRDGEATEIVTKGRHDPCVGIRGVPVVEAMMALVLADQKLLHKAQCDKSISRINGDQPACRLLYDITNRLFRGISRGFVGH